MSPGGSGLKFCRRVPCGPACSDRVSFAHGWSHCGSHAQSQGELRSLSPDLDLDKQKIQAAGLNLRRYCDAQGLGRRQRQLGLRGQGQEESVFKEV